MWATASSLGNPRPCRIKLGTHPVIVDNARPYGRKKADTPTPRALSILRIVYAGNHTISPTEAINPLQDIVQHVRSLVLPRETVTLDGDGVDAGVQRRRHTEGGALYSPTWGRPRADSSDRDITSATQPSQQPSPHTTGSGDTYAAACNQLPGTDAHALCCAYMRTTISLESRVAGRVRREAAARGVSVSAFIAATLDDAFKRQTSAAEAKLFRLITVGGDGPRPGINLDRPRAIETEAAEFPSRANGDAITAFVSSGATNQDQCEIRRVLVVFQTDEDGWEVASCPTLPGCHSQGRTREEALDNIREAIRGYFASLGEHDAAEPLSSEYQIIEVQV